MRCLSPRLRHLRARNPLPRLTGVNVFRRLQGLYPYESRQFRCNTVNATKNNLPLLGFLLLMVSIIKNVWRFRSMTATLEALPVVQKTN